MKNILLATRPLTPPWDEASKNFAYFLAKSIRDPELQLHLLTVKHPSPARGEGQGEVGALEGLGENCTEHPIYPKNDENHAGFPLWQKAILPLWLAWQTRRYAIVHYLFTPTKFNAFLIKNINLINGVMLNLFQHLKKFTGIPKQVRDDKFSTPKTIQTIATLREDLYTPEDWKQMFFADQLVTYSDYSKHKLEEVGFTSVQRIYPGIDLEKYSPRPKDTEAMKHFNLTPEDFVVLYPGEYVRLGATDMLVEMLIQHLPHPTNLTPALSSAQERGQSPSQRIVFIFGNRIKNEADRKKKEEVVEKLISAGIIDRVRFTDTWKDMPTLYNLADVVVFPAGDMKGKFDIPLAIIEPYACAKPVILSDLPIFAEFSNPEISVTISTRQNLDEGGSRGNGRALWQAIEHLQGNEAKRKSLGANAKAFVEQNFDLRETARAYRELYSTLQ